MTASENIPDDLAKLFADALEVTDHQLESLRVAGEILENDPGYRADFIKGNFVTSILEIMRQLNVSQSDLASKWGKSKSYLSKILAEDARVNFTIETMSELCGLLNRRLHVSVEDLPTAHASFLTTGNRTISLAHRKSQLAHLECYNKLEEFQGSVSFVPRHKQTLWK